MLLPAAEEHAETKHFEVATYLEPDEGANGYLKTQPNSTQMDTCRKAT